MLKLIIPIVAGLAGAGAGVGAAVMTRAAPPVLPADATDIAMKGDPCGPSVAGIEGAITPPPADGTTEYARLSNQFVIPVVLDGEVASLVVLSLSIEVNVGLQDNVFEKEPRLRDAFLQVLFDHANSGGFAGNFVDNNTLALLRRGLKLAAIDIIGNGAHDVLIVDLIRQDV